jgi:hypothetical protein
MALFAKEKPETAPTGAVRSDHETAFFGAKLSVKGKVSGSGNLIVMGKLEGEFDLNGSSSSRRRRAQRRDQAVSVTVSGNVAAA